MRVLLITFLKFYRYFISPLSGKNFRFYPSRSLYALAALHDHGVAQGAYLKVRRILNHHPFREGGLHPVPENFGKKNG